MALIGIHDSEAEYSHSKVKFPNFALMKLSAWHKKQGDEVEWWQPLNNHLYEKVYSSKVFSFTPENPYLPECTERGGVGYGLYNELPPEIDCQSCDYSIYPDCDYAIGFLTRGCPNKCDYCAVWKKEGNIRPYSNWRDIVRSDTNKLVIMDNNILACKHGINQLSELSETDYRLDLNQGMDITRLDEDIVKILAKIKWIKYIRFSCDKTYQLPYFEKMAELFRKHGISLSRVFIYLLVRQGDCFYGGNADLRVQTLNGIYKNFNLYAQAERNEGVKPNRAQLEFAQRYVYGKSYKKENWEQYCKRNNFEFEDSATIRIMADLVNAGLRKNN